MTSTSEPEALKEETVSTVGVAFQEILHTDTFTVL